MSFRFTDVTKGRISFFLTLGNTTLCVSLFTFSLSIHVLMDFYIIFFTLAVVTSGAINIGLRVSLQDPVSILFEHMLRSEITGIYSSSELIEKLPYCFT